VAPSHKNQNVMLLPACLGQFLGRFSSDFPFKWDSLPSDPNMLSLAPVIYANYSAEYHKFIQFN